MPTAKARKALDAAIDFLNSDEFVGLDEESEAEIRQTMEGLYTYLKRNMGKGCRCFGCGKNVAIDRRWLNVTMVKGLLWLYGQYKKRGRKWVYVPDAKSPLIRTNQHPTLKHWGLVDIHKRRGWFRISKLGIDFVEERAQVPAWVDIFDDGVLRASDEQVWVYEVHEEGDKAHRFDWSDVLAEVDVDDEVLQELEAE